MNKRPRMLLSMICALVCSMACARDDGEFITEIGVIEHHVASEVEALDSPASVRQGEPLDLKVRTFGDGCVSPDRIEAEGEDPLFLTPYDRRETDSGCLTSLYEYFHSVRLTFDVPGTQRLIVRGRRIGEGQQEEFIEQAFTIVVED